MSGVTFVELLITLSIIAILSGLVVPGLRTMITNNRLLAEVTDLSSDLVFARSEAVRRGGTVSICASSNGTSCTSSNWTAGRIVFTDTGTVGTVDGTDAVLKVTPALATGDTLTTSATTSSIQFASDGSASTALTFTPCQTGFTRNDVVLRRIGLVSTVARTSACP